MAYVKPGVKIIQEFQNLTPNINKPDLPAVIVGPCYQVVRKESVLDEIPFADFSDTLETSEVTTINTNKQYILGTTFIIGSRNLDIAYTDTAATITRRVGFDLADSGVDIADPAVMTDQPLFRELVRLDLSQRFISLPAVANLAALKVLIPAAMWELRQTTDDSEWFTSYLTGLPEAVTAGDTTVSIAYGYLFETLLGTEDLTFVLNSGESNEEAFTISGISTGPWGVDHNGHSFDTSPGSYTLTAQSDATGGFTTCATASTAGLSNGDYVLISGTSNYNGVHQISKIVSNTSFDIEVTFVSDNAAGAVVGPVMSQAHVAGETVEVFVSASVTALTLTAQALGTGGAGFTKCSTADTGTLANGEYVTITGTTDYNGTFKVTDVVADTSFDIAVTFDSDDAAGSADILIEQNWFNLASFATSYFPAVSADRTVTSDRVRFNFPVADTDVVNSTVKQWPVTIPYPNPQNYITPDVDQSGVLFYMTDAWVEIVDVHEGAQSIQSSQVAAAAIIGATSIQIDYAYDFLSTGDTFIIGANTYKAGLITKDVSAREDAVTLDIIAHPTGLTVALSEDDAVTNLPYKTGFRVGQRFFVDPNVDFSAEGVVPGDKIVIDGNGGTYLVQSVDATNSNKIHLTSEIYHTVYSALTTGSGDTDQYGYKIQRYHEEFQLPTGFENGQDYIAQENDVLVVAIEDEDGNPAVSGKLAISYRAFRIDAPVREEYETVEDVLSDMEIDIWNPLGLGLYITLINTTTSVVGLALTQDTELGYTMATELEQNYDDYAFVPLSQSTTVAGIFHSHVTQMSLPEHSKFRVGLYNTPLQTTSDVIAGFQGALTQDPSETLMSKYTFVMDDAEGDFYTNEVRVGQVVEFDRAVLQQVTKDTLDAIVAGPTAFAMPALGVFKVKEIKSSTQIEFGIFNSESGAEMAITFDDVAGQTTTLQLDTSAPLSGVVDYSIIKSLSKNEQADTIASIAESYLSRRAYLIWPDKIQISYNNEVTEQPGYYLACAIAGMIAGLPPQQGFTRLGITGVEGILNSNTYFSEVQLNKMAEKGVYVVVQDVPGALPYSRHQLSTDPTTLQTAELSITKDIDYFSFWVRDALKAHIGVRNIFDETLTLIENICEAVITEATIEKVERAGPVLISGELVSVRANLNGKNTDLPQDKVEVIINATPPYPLNDITVHVVV